MVWDLVLSQNSESVLGQKRSNVWVLEKVGEKKKTLRADKFSRNVSYFDHIWIIVESYSNTQKSASKSQ